MNRFQLVVLGDSSTSQSIEYPSVIEPYIVAGNVLTIGNLNGQIGVAVHEQTMMGYRVWTMQKGFLRDVDTSAWLVGESLWADQNGNPTNVEPSAVSLRVKLGTVVYSDANSGVVFIDVVVYPGIDDLTGVDLDLPVALRELLFFSDLGGGVKGLQNRLLDHGADPEALSLFDDDHPQYGPIVNGFEDRTKFEIQFVDLSPGLEYGMLVLSVVYGQTGRFWSEGIRHECTGAWLAGVALDPAVPPVDGLWIFYLDGTGTMQVTQTINDALFVDYATVAAVYWDSELEGHIFLADMRHGRKMDADTRALLRNTERARIGVALDIFGLSTDQSGSDAAHAQCSVNGGFIWAADLRHTAANGSPQVLDPVAQIPLFYLSGPDWYWRKCELASLESSVSPSASISPSSSISPSASASASTPGVSESASISPSASPSTMPPGIQIVDFPLANVGSGRAAWNNLNYGGPEIGAVVEATNSYFVLTHLFATGNVEAPIIGVMGQDEYASLSDAEAGAIVEIDRIRKDAECFLFGMISWLVPEFREIGTLIFQTNDSYGNAVKSRTRATTAGADYIDWRRRA